MKGKKIIIMKNIVLKKTLSNFLTIFFVILICINLLGLIFVSDSVLSIKGKLKEINSRIEKIEKSNRKDIIQEDINLNDFYKELTNKTDEAINRILTVVSVIATVVTLFGILLSFKAPHDINKRIDNIDMAVNKAENSAEEAKYQAEILNAINIDLNGNLTNTIKIKQLSEVIKRYPDKPDAYMQRGYIYNQMARDATNEKREEYFYLEITNYNIAQKLGMKKNICLLALGVAHNVVGKYKEAIRYYDSVIKLEPNNATAYANRGNNYCKIGDLKKALKDIDKAIQLDNSYFGYFLYRSDVYRNLWSNEDSEKKDEYIELQIADLKKAIELNPEDSRAETKLNKLYDRLKKLGITYNT